MKDNPIKMQASGVITDSQLEKLIKKQAGKHCIHLDLLYFEKLESYIDYANAIKFPKKSKAWGNAYFSKEGHLIKIHISQKDLKNDKIVKNQIFYYWKWLEKIDN